MRRFKRLPVRLSALIFSQEDLARAFPCEVVSLSEGGALIETTDTTLHAGTEVVLQFQEGDELLIKGKVLQLENVEIEIEDGESTEKWNWAKGDHGFLRISFEPLPADRLESFKKYLKDLETSATLKRYKSHT